MKINTLISLLSIMILASCKPSMKNQCEQAFYNKYGEDAKSELGGFGSLKKLSDYRLAVGIYEETAVFFMEVHVKTADKDIHGGICYFDANEMILNPNLESHRSKEELDKFKEIKIEVDSTLKSICIHIQSLNKSLDEWIEGEPNDTIQEGNYIGGFKRSNNDRFNFTLYINDDIEYWIILSLEEIDEIASGKTKEIEVTKVDYTANRK